MIANTHFHVSIVFGSQADVETSIYVCNRSLATTALWFQEVESIPQVKALTCLYSVTVLTSLFTLGMASWPPLSH